MQLAHYGTVEAGNDINAFCYFILKSSNI